MEPVSRRCTVMDTTTVTKISPTRTALNSSPDLTLVTQDLEEGCALAIRYSRMASVCILP